MNRIGNSPKRLAIAAASAESPRRIERRGADLELDHEDHVAREQDCVGAALASWDFELQKQVPIAGARDPPDDALLAAVDDREGLFPGVDLLDVERRMPRARSAGHEAADDLPGGGRFEVPKACVEVGGHRRVSPRCGIR